MAESWECEQIGDCTLYRGDAAEVLPMLGSVDTVLTDPPWIQTGPPLKIAMSSRGRRPAAPRYTLAANALGQWDSRMIALCEQLCHGDMFVFAGYKELGPLIMQLHYYRGTFAWQKPNAPPAVFYPAKMDLAFIVWAAEHSALYGYQHWPSMVFHIARPASNGPERLEDPFGKTLHPAQGPLTLYEQLLAPLPSGTCLDPFMGTGTTGVACVKQRRAFIGIEIHKPYFQLACERIRQAYNQLTLFPAALARAGTTSRQESLF